MDYVVYRNYTATRRSFTYCSLATAGQTLSGTTPFLPSASGMASLSELQLILGQVYAVRLVLRIPLISCLTLPSPQTSLAAPESLLCGLAIQLDNVTV